MNLTSTKQLFRNILCKSFEKTSSFWRLFSFLDIPLLYRCLKGVVAIVLRLFEHRMDYYISIFISIYMPLESSRFILNENVLN